MNKKRERCWRERERQRYRQGECVKDGGYTVDHDWSVWKRERASEKYCQTSKTVAKSQLISLAERKREKERPMWTKFLGV